VPEARRSLLPIFPLNDLSWARCGASASEAWLMASGWGNACDLTERSRMSTVPRAATRSYWPLSR